MHFIQWKYIQERQSRRIGGGKIGKENEAECKQHQQREEAEGCRVNKMGIAD